MNLLIAGKWFSSNDISEVINPYDGSIVDTVPNASPKDVNRALESACRGFQIMRKMPAHKKCEIFTRVAQAIHEQREDLAISITLEAGKLIKESRTEIWRVAQTFEFAAEESKRIHGETLQFDYVPGYERRRGFWLRFPIGVVSAISPFNFPALLAYHKIAPGLAAGNAIVSKPPLKTPLTVLKIGQILLNAGLPPEALNILTGRDEEIGDMLVTDPRVSMISFTGSAKVGEMIKSKSGLKKITLELGSNAPCIITEDADLEAASSAVVRGGYANAGQVCISLQRVYVQKSIYEEFLSKLVPKVAQLVVGNPLDEKTDVGPMVSPEAVRRVRQWVDEAIAGGAKLLVGGECEGTKFQPAVLVDVKPEMKVIAEELFGPVVCVIPYENLSEAFAMVNASKYGLQAGIFTNDHRVAWQAIEEIQVGGLLINDIPAFRVENMPYGGIKSSGLGREGVRFAIEEMTYIKLVCFNL